MDLAAYGMGPLATQDLRSTASCLRFPAGDSSAPVATTGVDGEGSVDVYWPIGILHVPTSEKQAEPL